MPTITNRVNGVRLLVVTYYTDVGLALIPRRAVMVTVTLIQELHPVPYFNVVFTRSHEARLRRATHLNRTLRKRRVVGSQWRLFNIHYNETFA